jgi:hypothetical protein
MIPLSGVVNLPLGVEGIRPWGETRSGGAQRPEQIQPLKAPVSDGSSGLGVVTGEGVSKIASAVV